MDPTITVGWGLHFGFGIDLDKGFYFVSKWDDPDETGDDNPERRSISSSTSAASTTCRISIRIPMKP
jgi:hypothetical protein